VVKVSCWEELVAESNVLFRQSDVLIAQEYVYTDFDWRIGIVNGEPLYACKYFMSRGHWQIYNHSATGDDKAGRFETFLVEDAPKEVVDLALKTAALIGDGFYGVDIKDKDGRLMIIEVNDNPSVESDIEDLRLGDVLYKRVLREFLDRRERKRGVH
jgi:glutathione synthase/RimK-type ligase-like ATP-grasp enzyme